MTVVSLLRRRSLAGLHRQAAESDLPRPLGHVHLVLLGIGAIVGAPAVADAR